MLNIDFLASMYRSCGAEQHELTVIFSSFCSSDACSQIHTSGHKTDNTRLGFSLCTIINLRK